MVPDITILAWENEAKLTSGYLNKRLKAGEFEDNLPEGAPLNSVFTYSEDTNLLTQILYTENEVEEQELGLAMISSFRYKGYSARIGDSDRSNVVKCNVLNFSDGSFMFLVKDAKVIAEQDSICLSKFSELEEGAKVFWFEASRSVYKKMAKHNKEVSEALETLDIWHSILWTLFEKSNQDVGKLEKQLEEIRESLNEGGNPSANNLRRWLHDEDLISPRDSNLKVILTAGEINNIESVMSEIHKASAVFRAFKRLLSKEIESYIAKKGEERSSENGEFEMMVPGTGIKVKVLFRTITSLVKEEHEVRYSDTNRILC